MNASAIRVVCTVHANSHGNATAKKDGVDFSVIKILTTAHITNLARMGLPAQIQAKEATLALAVQATLDPTVRLRSMNAIPTLVKMEEAALT